MFLDFSCVIFGIKRSFTSSFIDASQQVTPMQKVLLAETGFL
jgi:hypothetical protein